MTQQPNNKSGNFHWFGKGLVGLLSLVVLGGGVLAFYQISKNNTNSPTSGNIINNTSQGGTGGSADVDVNVKNPETSDSQNISPENSSSSSNNALKNNSGIGDNPDLNNQPLKSIIANSQKWGLTYPIYKIQESQCILAGDGSVILEQNAAGQLFYNGYLNLYNNSNIQGSIFASGKMRASIQTYNGEIIELKSTNFSQEPTTIFQGTAKMRDCPDSTFELELN
jgi:hypothetical protein